MGIKDCLGGGASDVESGVTSNVSIHFYDEDEKINQQFVVNLNCIFFAILLLLLAILEIVLIALSAAGLSIPTTVVSSILLAVHIGGLSLSFVASFIFMFFKIRCLCLEETPRQGLVNLIAGVVVGLLFAKVIPNVIAVVFSGMSSTIGCLVSVSVSACILCLGLSGAFCVAYCLLCFNEECDCLRIEPPEVEDNEDLKFGNPTSSVSTSGVAPPRSEGLVLSPIVPDRKFPSPRRLVDAVEQESEGEFTDEFSEEADQSEDDDDDAEEEIASPPPEPEAEPSESPVVGHRRSFSAADPVRRHKRRRLDMDGPHSIARGPEGRSPRSRRARSRTIEMNRARSRSGSGKRSRRSSSTRSPRSRKKTHATAEGVDHG